MYSYVKYKRRFKIMESTQLFNSFNSDHMTNLGSGEFCQLLLDYWGIEINQCVTEIKTRCKIDRGSEFKWLVSGFIALDQKIESKTYSLGIGSERGWILLKTKPYRVGTQN